MRRLALAILVVLFTPGAATAQHPVLALLDEYAAGRYSDVREALVQLEDVAEAREALEKGGRAWVESGADGTIDQRRVIAATFALEFANARMLDEWQRLRSLVEWGCELLRDGPPSEAERQWQLASVALAQGARDWAVLYPRPVSSRPVRVMSYQHLRHARGRFPDDVQLVFADPVVASLQFASAWPRRGGTGGARPNVDAVRNRFETIRILEPFTADPLVGGEAELRIGVARLGLPDPELALSHFEAAGHSPDAFVAYLAHFLIGRELEAADRPDEAAASYRRALAVLPGTQSASLALASLLFADGHPDAAYGLAARALDSATHPEDPWRLYGYGQYRDFERYMSRLRREIRTQ